jgi:hypothetical protein
MRSPGASIAEYLIFRQSDRARKHSICNTLSDNHNALTIRFIACIEISTSEQRNAQRLKVVVAYGADICFNFLTRRWNWIAFDVEASGVCRRLEEEC